MHLLVVLLIPLLGGVCGAGLVAGLLQAVTAIEDHSIAVISRVFGLALALTLFALPLQKQLFEYTSKVWSSSEYFN